jgi:predicted nucleic acid-binding protein
LAAYAIQHQGEVRSNDTDFARFPDLKRVNHSSGRQLGPLLSAR